MGSCVFCHASLSSRLCDVLEKDSFFTYRWWRVCCESWIHQHELSNNDKQRKALHFPEWKCTRDFSDLQYNFHWSVPSRDSLMMDPVGSTNLGGIHFELGRGFRGQLLSKEMSHEFSLFKNSFQSRGKEISGPTTKTFRTFHVGWFICDPQAIKWFLEVPSETISRSVALLVSISLVTLTFFVSLCLFVCPPTDRLTGCLTDWMIVPLTNQPTPTNPPNDWPTDRPVDLLTDWPTDRLTKWLTDCLTVWLTNWPTAGVSGRLTD